MPVTSSAPLPRTSASGTPRPARRRTPGGLLVVAGAVLWGTVGTAQALSPYAGSPLGLATARSGLAGLILLVIAAVTHGRDLPRLLLRPGVHGTDHRRVPRPRPAAHKNRPARRFLLLGAASMAVYQASFLTAMHLSGVSAGTLVAMGSAPLFAGVLGVLTGQRTSTRWLLATTVAVAGLAVLLTPGVVTTAGAVTGLAAGMSFASYTWCSRRALDAGVPAVPLLAVFFVGAAVALAPFGGVDAVAWCLSPGGATVVVYLSVVATVTPYLVWIRGMASTAPAAATTLALAEPLTAAVLAVARLGEPVTGRLAAGAALLAVGLLLTTARRATPRRP
ncbi:EamA family transporter [Actinoplanes sp. NPDC049548]|uniref:DMT family transporter n=1 Tax=Actinoplanes sp. NPDC049548 TaxID=3155152 RepID=UPI003439CB77